MAEVREYLEHECAVFHKTRDTFGPFSNMAKGFGYVINGHKIKSSEHHYQAARYPDHPELQQMILAIENPIQAKREAYKFIELTREDWQSVNIRIMKHALRLRYAFNRPSLGALYQQSGDMPIVEKSTRDDFWGAKPVHGALLRGVNALGRLHMGLRQEIMAEPDAYTQKVDAMDIPNYRLCDEDIEDVEIPQDHVAPAWQPDFGL
jgi:ribA/ribD-fused uncharacterized protein